MQTLILNGGEKIEIEKIIGETIYADGIPRESLSFYLEDKNFKKALELFTEENCKVINVIDGENKFLHEGYQIRNYVKLEGESLIVNMIKISNTDLELNKLKEETADIKNAIIELTTLIAMKREG